MSVSIEIYAQTRERQDTELLISPEPGESARTLDKRDSVGWLRVQLLLHPILGVFNPLLSFFHHLRCLSDGCRIEP